MPKYRITAPDGRSFEVTAPEGASQDQVLAFAQSQWSAKPAPEKAPDPTEGMSTGGRLLAGIGKGMVDLGRGAGQRLRDVLPESASNALGLPTQAEIDEAKRLDAPLMGTTSGSVGNIIGKVAAGLPAAFVPGANTLAGAGVIGGVQGLLEPTASGESVLKNAGVGAAGGVGGVMLGRGLRAGYQGVKGLVEPFTAAGQERIAGRVLNRFAADPTAARYAFAGPTATGATPTLAEATKDTGIASLERSLSQQDPQIAARFAQRAADNNAARVGVIQDLAGNAGARQAAQAARDAAAGDMYQSATKALYTVDDDLSSLLQRPAVKQAMQRAQVLAENKGRNFAFEVTPANPFSGVGVPTNTTRQISGQGLQDLKMAMDEMLSDPTSGFTGKSGDAVRALRGRLVDWMESANPDFKTARQAYAEASKPINQMDVGQRLLEKTTGAMRDLGGNQRLQANAFSRALNDEQGLVRNATGFRGVNELSDVLTPQQMNLLGAVRSELETSANLAQAANGPGSQTAKSLASQNLLRQILGPTGLPQSWAESTLLETALRPVQFGMKAAEPRIQSKLADVLLDPRLAGSAMDAAAPKPLSPALQRLLPYLQQAGQQSGPAALVSR